MSPVNETTSIINTIKDAVGLIISGLAGAITHISYKSIIGESMSFGQAIGHIIISGFVGLMAGFICLSFELSFYISSIIVGISSYSGVKIIEVIEGIKAKTITDLLIDYIKYKLGVKK